jgi:hypothetical protein
MCFGATARLPMCFPSRLQFVACPGAQTGLGIRLPASLNHPTFTHKETAQHSGKLNWPLSHAGSLFLFLLGCPGPLQSAPPNE